MGAIRVDLDSSAGYRSADFENDISLVLASPICNSVCRVLQNFDLVGIGSTILLSQVIHSNRFEKNWFPNVSRCGTKENVRSQGEASSGSSRNLNASFKSPSKIHLVELMIKLVGYLTPYKSGTRICKTISPIAKWDVLSHENLHLFLCHLYGISCRCFLTLHQLFRCRLQPNRHSVKHISRYLSDRYSSIRTSIFQPFLPHNKR